MDGQHLHILWTNADPVPGRQIYFILSIYSGSGKQCPLSFSRHD